MHCRSEVLLLRRRRADGSYLGLAVAAPLPATVAKMENSIRACAAAIPMTSKKWTSSIASGVVPELCRSRHRSPLGANCRASAKPANTGLSGEATMLSKNPQRNFGQPCRLPSRAARWLSNHLPRPSLNQGAVKRSVVPRITPANRPTFRRLSYPPTTNASLGRSGLPTGTG